ncbi:MULTISPECIES: sulfite exporter TauE/SafE family protein [Streptococcus]|uniref:Probable membrane transporter protein n=1 Tax=Streptococcus anginosus T5 TaxID=1163302 RepID=A0AAN4T5G6_STRAP|nr:MULTISPECIES: sulfite exporter TauE/SafE family protein [Streptococcus]MBF7051282.1 sulfite exporter TauE/SafE family protein [Streptococcus sp. HF-2466]GAD46371.1 hypothetical protein ANG6_0866 [Streptococcus anginosus T5]
MEIILYTLIVLFATALGAVTGAGGGAIIKPVFDLVGMDTAGTISVYSTIAVFSMCLSSIYKHSKSGIVLQKKIMLGLSIGSLAGGLLGDTVFKVVTDSIPNERVTFIQSIFLFLVLFSVLIFTRFSERIPKAKWRNLFFSLAAGFAAGLISVFLGIGGGPLNIIILMGFMSYSAKESVPYSIAMIFFAQIPKILKLLLQPHLYSFNLTLIPLIVIAAVVGGNIGTHLNHHFNEKQVTNMYTLMMLGLLLTCLTNIISNF